MKTNIRNLTLSLATLLTLTTTTVNAENLIQNGSFENFEVITEKNNWKKVHLEGWDEVSKVNFAGRSGTNGSAKVALDNNKNFNTLTQSITTVEGLNYRLSVDAYAYRKKLATSHFEIIVDDTVIATIIPSTVWEEYAVSFVGIGGEQRIGFREVASQNDGKGVLLDNVALNVQEDLAQNFGIATQGAVPYYATEHTAVLAIDGDNSTYSYTEEKELENWFQVALPTGTKISKVVVVAASYKPYRLEGASVYVSREAGIENLGTATKLGTLTGDSSEQIFTTNEEASYVFIKAADDNKLHLATVEVYGTLSEASKLTHALRSGKISGLSEKTLLKATLDALEKSTDKEYEDLRTMFTHFVDADYNFDWSTCTGKHKDHCIDEVVGFKDEFYRGARDARKIFKALDKEKINIFEQDAYEIEKLIILTADKFRESVKYVMQKGITSDMDFLKSYFADHAVYNVRKVAPAQADMGNFSHSDFSTVTPVNRVVKMQSQKHFRSTGAYALPGQTFKVTRVDSSAAKVNIFINTLRFIATKEFRLNTDYYNDNGYNRPKYLESTHIEIAVNESIELTSVYGGPIQLEFFDNGLEVEFKFENVGEHPYWASPADNEKFTKALDEGKYNWAEISSAGFEVHSRLDKMRESVANERWGTAEALANGMEKYTSNYPHVLAGFKGKGIDVVAEIHDFATENGFAIQDVDFVKHMNADQASVGWGASGNPYDAFWAFDPVGHGDIHEIGHALEAKRFRLEGAEVHSSTNPYAFYTQTQYNKNGGAFACKVLPFESFFEKLQAGVNSADTEAYLSQNLWASSNWASQFIPTLQAMMHAQKMNKLDDGWHLLSRLQILERAIDEVKEDWENKKHNIGFSTYAQNEFETMRNNDWIVVSFSYAVGLDYRPMFDMMGIGYSEKASAQIASFNFTAVPKKFFASSPSGYCSQDNYGSFLDKKMLDVDGKVAWE